MTEPDHDVVVVGGGNAALCAAISAREQGATVLVLERAPEETRGGNSRFTAGGMRVVYTGVDDLLKIMDLNEREIAETDFGTYTEAQFYDDMGRVTRYRADPDLAEVLITRSLDTLVWMRSKGLRFLPMYGRQAFKIDGRFKFWGGLTVETAGGGPGLVESLYKSAETQGIEVLYGAHAVELAEDDGRINGVRIRRKGANRTLRAGATVLACGGFEANAEWRARYLGPNWDLGKVRGTRFNTGDGIRMRTVTGRDAMPSAGTVTRPISAISPSATASKSTAIPSAS
jgi:tricarballylate dehydrogenase